MEFAYKEYIFSIWTLEELIQARSSAYPHFEKDGGISNGSDRINRGYRIIRAGNHWIKVILRIC